jgi:hypothetical protein
VKGTKLQLCCQASQKTSLMTAVSAAIRDLSSGRIVTRAASRARRAARVQRVRHHVLRLVVAEGLHARVVVAAAVAGEEHR